MDQFKGSGYVHHILRLFPPVGLEDKQGDQGTDPFPPAMDEMGGNIREGSFTGTYGEGQVLLHQLQFFGHAIEQIL